MYRILEFISLTWLEHLCLFSFCTGSVVAKLTLEVTGIPELSPDRGFAWPSPTFFAPTNAHTFEVSSPSQLAFFSLVLFRSTFNVATGI